jgi:iron-sulfur cluster repair protein YtfE (RIC family)
MDTTRGTFHNVTEYLAWDHDGQEDALIDARDAVDRGDLAGAFTYFDLYQHKLMRHMRLEERILFPLVESLTPQLAHSVDEMRHEHAQARHTLAILRQALVDADVVAFHHAFDQLGLILMAHEAREERIIYPILDRSLSPEQRVDLAARLASER